MTPIAGRSKTQNDSFGYLGKTPESSRSKLAKMLCVNNTAEMVASEIRIAGSDEQDDCAGILKMLRVCNIAILIATVG